MSTDRSHVVVGFDGSKTSASVVAWAVTEARSRNVPLRLVHAYSGVQAYTSMAVYGGVPMPDATYLRAAAQKLLADAAAALATTAPDVEVSTRSVEGDPVSILLEESTVAATVVLGSRQLGDLAAAVLGSVSSAVVAHAKCPVVVVRGSTAPSLERTAIVVGVEPDKSSEDAIRYAFDHASRRALPLHAVLCWHRDALADMLWRDEPAVPMRAEALLSEALAGWREKYPDVDVHTAVTRAHPVDGLVAASHAQHLLVVGTRGRGAVTGLLLGSVSQGVLHHATCPVAVVGSLS
jgi:nucleotide-binding universal stress UspA family protein